MMAAGTAISYGASVVLYEAMPLLGKKLGITGKGRCNVTNACSRDEFFNNVTKNPRFLYSALNALSQEETMAFFEGLGVELKTERGGRVFPTSDRARDIVDALRKYSAGAEVRHEKVNEINRLENGKYVINRRSEEFDAVILATGGKSYPLTGSDGSGYTLARSLGHTVTKLIPSLIPITSPAPICKELQGLSLKNVAIKIIDASGKTVYTDFGEMMFTHFGVTGPVILSASARIRELKISSLTLSIDLKPALDDKTLDKRLLHDFAENANEDFINSLGDLLPAKLIEPFVRLTYIDPRKKVNSLTREERGRVLRLLKGIEIPLGQLRPIDEAIITSGGISVNEVRPSTMESKLSPRLYFAGEMLDVDAYTGGFNLQIAFSTGYLAGKNAAESLFELE